MTLSDIPLNALRNVYPKISDNEHKELFTASLNWQFNGERSTPQLESDKDASQLESDEDKALRPLQIFAKTPLTRYLNEKF